MASRDEIINQRKKDAARVRQIWAKSFSTPLSALHLAAAQDREAKGPVWVSRVSWPAPLEADMQQALWEVVEDLGGRQDLAYNKCHYATVEGEWVGHRAGVGPKEPEPKLSEAQKFQELRKEAPQDGPTILFVHGGGLKFVSHPFDR